MPTPSTLDRLTLALPSDLVDKYKAQAREIGVPFHTLVIDRLTTCADHTSTTPLYITDEQRSRLQTLLGSVLRDSDQLMDYLERLLSVVLVNGADTPVATVHLDKHILQRINARRFGRSLEQTFETAVLQGLMNFCNL